MPSGLASAVIGKKKRKNKNVTHANWSGHDCHQPPKKETQKMSVAVISKKKGKTKNVTHALWSGLHCQWAIFLRKNKKCHARHMVWPWPSSAKKRKYKKFSRTPSGLDVIAIGQNKIKNEKCHARNMVWL
jgi:hypothetical protein